VTVVTSWYPLTDAEHSARHSHVLDIDAPPAAVWAALTADDALASWSPLVSAVSWETPRPFGVGTVRVVTLGPGVLALRERFWCWEDEHRMAFTVDAATRPGLRSFGEDVELTPTATGTRVRWTFGYTPVPLLRPAFWIGGPLNHLATRSIVHGLATRVGVYR